MWRRQPPGNHPAGGRPGRRLILLTRLVPRLPGQTGLQLKAGAGAPAWRRDTTSTKRSGRTTRGRALRSDQEPEQPALDVEKIMQLVQFAQRCEDGWRQWFVSTESSSTRSSTKTSHGTGSQSRTQSLSSAFRNSMLTIFRPFATASRPTALPSATWTSSAQQSCPWLIHASDRRGRRLTYAARAWPGDHKRPKRSRKATLGYQLTPANHNHRPSRGLVEDVVADESAQVKASREEAALDNDRFSTDAWPSSPPDECQDRAWPAHGVSTASKLPQ
jgi:hypothetical protein